MKKSAMLLQVEKMSDAELAKFISKQIPRWRLTLNRLRGFLKAFGAKLGRKFRFLSTASDVVLDQSGGSGGVEASDSLVVEKFDVPSPRVLQQYIDALDGIGDIDAMEEMINRHTRSENKELKKVGAALVPIRDALIDAYVDALDTIKSLADNKIPDPVARIFKAGEKYIDKQESDYLDTLSDEKLTPAKKKKREKVVDYYLSIGVKDGSMDFVWNADITNLPHESGSERLCAVITARLIPSDDTFTTEVYVNVLPRIALPHMYNLGTRVPHNTVSAVNKALEGHLRSEMSIHGMRAFLGSVELKIDETEVNSRLMKIEGVNGVAFDTNAIIIEMSDDRSVHAQVLRALDQVAEIKKAFKKGFEKSLQKTDENVYTYTLSEKH